MRGKTKLLVMLSALLLTMCRTYGENAPVSSIEGLSCRMYTDYFRQGSSRSQGLECYYTCPDKTVGPLDFEVDPGLSATKGDLDERFCGIEPRFTPTDLSASTSPTPTASPTATASPTPPASPTQEATPTTQSPLLTGDVTMCDTGANLISFRIAEPLPDLTDRTLTAQIAGQESMCYVNPTNLSVMTCTIPAGVTFPASILVSLDGAVVSDFVYNGLGCVQITTPVPTTTP